MKVCALTKKYNGIPVVDEVSFEVPQGQVLALIGPNGAGKSTVMGMLSRLVSRDQGQILLENRDIMSWPQKELARKLAILTQSNNVQMKLTIKDLVAFGRFPYCGTHLQPEDEEKVAQAIAWMELEDIQDHYLDELSGGQRQRAFIAMVIAQDTEYVLLDEPTNNLDIYHAARLMKTIRRLCDELQKTVILVLHELNYAAFYADSICAFKNGRIAAFGSVEEVMNKDTLGAVYDVDFEILRVNNKPLSVHF